jgi:predicted NBD/HSP70 family sugar kinase
MEGRTMRDEPGSPSQGSGATSEQLRQHNLSEVLGILHQEGPTPRSQLTSRTGLNRSTIATLVGELVERGLAFEVDPTENKQVGRPSPIVHVDPRTVAIAINPEVDAISAAVVGLDGAITRRVRVETSTIPTVAEAVATSASIIEKLRSELPEPSAVIGVGAAIPGLVRTSDGLVRLAPHLNWSDAPFGTMLADATGLTVSVGNDANLGAIAEMLFGAGRGVENLIYLNGGASGIGGGIIAGGRLIPGARGYAGEFGHVRVNSTSGSYDDLESGSLESEVNRAQLLAALGLASADADQLEAALLASSDLDVGALVHRQLEFLSTSLRNIVNVLNPEIIVLGGFLAAILSVDPEFLITRVRAQTLSASFEDLTIRPAELGSDLLFIGAAELAFENLLASRFDLS